MFYGIIIRMYYAPSEHPPPHFHVYYAEHTATVDIQLCELSKGSLPKKTTQTCSGLGGVTSGRTNGRLALIDEW